MSPDGYNLLPHEEIKRLKQEIDNLKRTNSFQKDSISEPLVETMNSLTHSINALLRIFKEAAEDMKLDEHDSVLLSDKIDPLIQKIDRVLEQNEKIAKGIVAIADMIEDMKSSVATEPPPRPVSRITPSHTPTPSPVTPQFSHDMSMEHPMNHDFGSPAPKPLPTGLVPPEEPKKKPLFNIKFK